MAILKIARMGHPVLRQIADPVTDIDTPLIRTLLADMADTMKDAGGTGIAAPQVHVGLRIVLYFVSAGRPGASDDVPLTALINPMVTPMTDEIAYDWEGCLSVPGLTGLVPRPTCVRLQATTTDGAALDLEATGFHARVLQHECDHLDGVLYPQRMDDLSLLLFSEEMRHGMPEKAKELMAAAKTGNDAIR